MKKMTLIIVGVAAGILTALPVQLLAYHTAVALGCAVAKPRVLATSVTVERASLTQ